MSNLQTSSANMTTIITAGQTALRDTAKVPKNINAGGNMNAITYNTPFSSASTTGTITSDFPTVLGSSNTGGLIGTTYVAVNAVLS